MSVRLRDPLDRLDQQALALLAGSKIAGQMILEPCVWRVDSESILFTREGSAAFTAWTVGMDEKKTILRIDAGFVATYD